MAGGDDVEILSATDFGMGTAGLFAVADFAIAANFGGGGSGGESGSVRLFADDSCGEGVLSGACSSIGRAVSITIDDAFVAALSLAGSPSKVGFS